MKNRCKSILERSGDKNVPWVRLYAHVGSQRWPKGRQMASKSSFFVSQNTLGHRLGQKQWNIESVQYILCFGHICRFRKSYFFDPFRFPEVEKHVVPDRGRQTWGIHEPGKGIGLNLNWLSGLAVWIGKTKLPSALAVWHGHLDWSSGLVIWSGQLQGCVKKGVNNVKMHKIWLPGLF